MWLIAAWKQHIHKLGYDNTPYAAAVTNGLNPDNEQKLTNGKRFG